MSAATVTRRPATTATTSTHQSGAGGSSTNGVGSSGIPYSSAAYVNTSSTNGYAPQHVGYPPAASATGYGSSRAPPLPPHKAAAQAGPPSYNPTTSYLPLRTAGDSWSLQKDGDKHVIVIEDTPPPSAPSTSKASALGGVVGGAGYASNAAKRTKYDTGSARSSATNQYAGHVVSNIVYPGPSSATTAPTYPSIPDGLPAASSSRKVSGAKRKYNEVIDPAAAVNRQVPPKAAVCDDKDGHYIIRPDDELGQDRRYKIIELLGQGTFGKVVKAYDRDARCLVAVKVIRAIQKYRDASKVEIKVLNLLRDRDPSNINKCIHLLDCFDHRNHICIVTKLLSCSVFDFLKDNNYLAFPASHIQSFAKQLLTSVAFLHDLRLVHTDLKPENILLVNSDHGTIPQRPTKAAPTVKTKRILKNSSIHLIDFGSATFEEEYHASVVSTRHYRAPEIILGLGWSYPCDVWSIGCILVEFFTGEALFQTHENLEHLAMMEIVFGKVPDTKWGKQATRSKPEWFQANGKISYPTPATTRQSRKYVKAMKPLEAVVPPTNIVNSRFLDLLGHLLKWDPAERYTVREALRHPFFSIRIDDEETRQISQPS